MSTASPDHSELRFTNGQPVIGGWPPDWQTDLRFAYLQWLHMEARMLRIEMWPGADPDMELTPDNTFAQSFHFPVGERWQEVTPPSARALRVLEAAGVEVPADVREAA